MSTGIAIFVKTPGLSPVKTRLAVSIGAERALAVYRDCVACVRASVERACELDDLTPYWAVAEAQAIGQWPGWPNLLQPNGDLGARMAGIYAQLRERHSSALLLGADVPAIEAVLIEAACRALQTERARVIAPAEDGGFVLFGANVDLPPDAWDQPIYGVPDTARQFLAGVGAQLHLTSLERQYDLDTIADLHALARRPPRNPTPEQMHFWARIDALSRV